MTKIEKYRDIRELFNFKILDGNLHINDKNEINCQYIYEITPISILDYSVELYRDIFNSYIEFLKSIDCNYKITIRNHKFNIDDYINESIINLNTDIKKLDFYHEYIVSLKKMIQNEKIYYPSIYLCVICNKEKIILIEENLNKLKSVGVGVIRLSDKELNRIIYESINKL